MKILNLNPLKPRVSILKPSVSKEAPKLNEYSYGITNPIKPSYVNFLGNINQYDDFQKTLEYNYFKLPKFTLENGETYQCKPDKGQVECAKKIYEGDTVIFEAPTGTGKTALAHYAVNKNLYDGKKTIITVPLISLANDKYREFTSIYGEENVGLLTGINKVNVNAPIQIMVTEILRNQTQSLNEHADEIGTIIFDEAHYIGDEDRGAVWENSIIAAAKSDIQMLCLSATLGNGEVFTDWVSSINPERKVSRVVIDPEDRFVPLSYSVYDPYNEEHFRAIKGGKVDLASIDEDNLTDRQKRALAEIYNTINNKNQFYEMSENEYISTFRNLKIKTGASNRVFYGEEFKDYLKEAYPELKDNQAEKVYQLLAENKWTDKIKVNSLEEDDFPGLVWDLQDADKLPALIFKLSQKGCDKISDDLLSQGVDLTTPEEKKQIKEIIDKYIERGASLGEDFGEVALLRGFGVHHAGKLPDYQELVEELFSKKLLKVVSATSTLSAGINMPVRTVVMTDVNYMKYNPETHSVNRTPLTPSEFHQMTGRAGRRGIDPVGYVVLYNLATKKKAASYKKQNNDNSPSDLKFAYDLIDAKPNVLTSNFRPEPCMIAQYYHENESDDNIEDTISKSFKIFLAKSPEKKTRTVATQFKQYTNILKAQGYIKDNKLTPKGELLRVSMGANPLMVSGLIHEEKLKNLTPEQLCQIAGYVASNDIQRENSDLFNITSYVFRLATRDMDDKNKLMKDYQDANKIYRSKEEKIENTMKTYGFDPDKIEAADSFGGLCTYLFANLNKSNDDSGANFDYIVNSALKELPFENDKSNNDRNQNKARTEFNRKATQGRIYKVIAQSISVLEQIERICDHALEDEKNFPNQKYYQNLKENVKQAQSLIKRPPFMEGSKA